MASPESSAEKSTAAPTKKKAALYLRVYNEPHLTALVQLIGYQGMPVPQAQKELEPLQRKFGMEK